MHFFKIFSQYLHTYIGSAFFRLHYNKISWLKIYLFMKNRYLKATFSSCVCRDQNLTERRRPNLSVAEALQVMFAFGGFIISLLTLVIALIMLDRQK